MKISEFNQFTNAEVYAMSMFHNMQTLEQLYCRDMYAVAQVKDILSETSDMLVAMLIAVSNVEATNSFVNTHHGS